MFTRISASPMLWQIYPWTIHCSKWWMGNAGIVKMVIRVSLWTKTYQWICTSILQIFVQKIFMLENAIWTMSFATLIFHLFCLQKYNQQRDEWQCLRLHYKGALRFFRFPKNNIRQSSVFMYVWYTHLPLF